MNKEEAHQYWDEHWYRLPIGGHWDAIGKLQFRFLCEHGLRPNHKLLDVGCGPLRGGVHFIKYLNESNYVGIDNDDDLIDGAMNEIKEHDLWSKKPAIVKMGNFDFPSLNTEFDYAVAISVFTHLPLNSIIRCLVNIEKVLKSGGKFYATFFENPEGMKHVTPQTQISDSMVLVTYFDKDPYHYDLGTFKWICSNINLEVEYIGEWGHLRNQKILCFLHA